MSVWLLMEQVQISKPQIQVCKKIYLSSIFSLTQPNLYSDLLVYLVTENLSFSTLGRLNHPRVSSVISCLSSLNFRFPFPCVWPLEEHSRHLHIMAQGRPWIYHGHVSIRIASTELWLILSSPGVWSLFKLLPKGLCSMGVEWALHLAQLATKPLHVCFLMALQGHGDLMGFFGFFLPKTFHDHLFSLILPW